MPMKSLAKCRWRGGGVIGILAAIQAIPAQAEVLVPGVSPQSEEELRALILEQTQRLEALRTRVVEEESKLREIRKVLGMDMLRDTRGTGPGPAGQDGGGMLAAPAQFPQDADRSIVAVQAQQTAAPPMAGGDSSSDGKPPTVAPIFEQPGVLTPRGKVVLEPGLQYSYSSSNRVSLVGYTVIPALTIGLIDVREVKRDTFTASLTGRWGITNRFELEAKIPYVYRSDSVVSRPLNLGSAQDQVFSSNGSGIGDVELTGRYQLNDGGLDRPYYIGTLRFKSRTGKDPFEVATNPVATYQGRTEGLQEELPTGSGFYTLQPGLTVLYPTDPAVFFGSLSYQYNFKRSNVSVNYTDGAREIGEVQPGGVFGFNFGMGLALNDRSSFSIGYDHASVGRLKQNGDYAPNSVRTQLGTLLLGYSYRVNKTTSLNLSVGAGVTRDTPDVSLSLRLPMSF